MTLESKSCSFMTSKGASSVREAWTGGSDNFVEGFSWPPRSYSCSFCHREFRSAQALGGHMNVHRRDRARLRVQSDTNYNHSSSTSSFLNLTTNHNPNPNPSFSSSAPSSPSSSKSTFTFLSPPPLSTCSAPSTKDINEKRQRVDHDSSSAGSYTKVVKNKKGSDHEIVGLDLEIGLQLGASLHDQDNSLDLELRLGCS